MSSEEVDSPCPWELKVDEELDKWLALVSLAREQEEEEKRAREHELVALLTGPWPSRPREEADAEYNELGALLTGPGEAPSRAREEADAEYDELVALTGPGEEAAECSRAREEAEARHRLQWVVLAGIPVVLGADHHRAWMVAPGTADLVLDPQAPPRCTYLEVPERIAPDPRRLGFPCVLATCSSRILFMATQGERKRIASYFLADPQAGQVLRLPDVPAELPVVAPRRNVGVIEDPQRRGEYMVVQLLPVAETRYIALLCYSTISDMWNIKPLASAPEHERWGAHGVFAHDGLLYWVDVAYGMLVCDPFADSPHLRFIALPVGLQMHGLGLVHGVRPSRLLDERRIIRPSEGKLRYVEIVGLLYNQAPDNNPADIPAVVNIWTLVHLEEEALDQWRFECAASFADIWAQPSYSAADLPHGVVPRLALIHPDNFNVVHFFLDMTLFSVDVRAIEVTSCGQCRLDYSYWKLNFQYSSFVHAWEMREPDGESSGVDGPQSGEEFAGGYHIVNIDGPNPLAHLRPAVNIDAPHAQPPQENMLTVTNAEVALRNVRMKLSTERRERVIQKLLRERKYLKDFLRKYRRDE